MAPATEQTAGEPPVINPPQQPTPGSSPPIEAGPSSASLFQSPGPSAGPNPKVQAGPSSSALPPPGKTRTPRPQGVKMPAPPYQNTTPGGSSGRGGSPRPNQRTPGGSDHSPTLSPSGPLSPGSSNLGQNSFIFPIRSVFQGMGQDGGEGSNQLNRVNSRGQPQSSYSDRRFSQVSTGPEDDDAGIATIAQLLQGQSLRGKEQQPTGQTATATFSGQKSHASSPAVAAGARNASPLPSSPLGSEPPHGFFSVPIPARETEESPFFGSRRASEGDEVPPQRQRSASDGSKGKDRQKGSGTSRPPQEAKRPDPPQHASSGSVSTTRPEIGDLASDVTTPSGDQPPHNPSAEADGTGLPDPSRRPVGVPQDDPAGINYSDKPGRPDPENNQFSAPGKQEKSVADGDGHAKQPVSSESTSIKQPTPRRADAMGMSALTSMPAAEEESKSAVQEAGFTPEQPIEGGPEVEADYAGIVRLPSLGAKSNTGPSGRGSGTGSKQSSALKSAPNTGSGQLSGPSAAALAQHTRAARDRASRTVQDFVNDQANTQNMSDPNAPTPVPQEVDEQERDRPSSAAATNNSSYAPSPAPATPASGSHASREWQERSETSLSVRDSSEMATASNDDQTGEPQEEEDEPIVTFRFEHKQTTDGHHVVVGREGVLRRCEDEPITTPGAVQGFGVLLVVEEDYDSGDLRVKQVSENATELLGLSPRYLFRLDCFSRVLTQDQEDILRDNIEYLPDADTGEAGPEAEGPQVFLLTGFGEPGSDEDEDRYDEDDYSSAGARRREWTAWVAAHRPKQPTWNKTDEDGNPIEPPNLIILEFELERDVYNPLMQEFEPAFSSETDTPDSGSQTTVSGGDRTLSSNNSAEVSSSSMTTVGSTPTPRPGPGVPAASSHPGSQETVHSTNSTETIGPSGSTKSSSNKKRFQPMGLEGLEMQMPLDRIIESTTNHAKPLRALERMRRTGNNSGSSPSQSTRSRRPRRPQRTGGPSGMGTTGTMDVFAVLGQINDQLGSAVDLESFLNVVVGVIQDVTRFHRVLLYQFDEAYNGQVVAELVEWGKTTDLFKGLMFPAADIPAQARQLYMANKVRSLYDRSQTTARMVLRDKEDLEHPLDMTHCYLRAMSPIHIKYLANMHVRSSMSVSIMAFGQLWGLIACHSYGYHGMRVSFPVRQMMRILSDSISRNIERLSYAQRLHTRKLISTIPTTSHPTGYIVSNADDLLQIFDADAGLLVIGDGCKLLGQTEQGQAMLAIAEYLRIMKFDSLKASNSLVRDFPDLVLPRAQDTIAGFLFVPLTAKAGQDFIVFLRKGQVREVKWAGKPYKDEKSGEAASLEPRKSFKTWSETVTGRSRAWTDDQLESAGVLALIYGKFIQVWREKQSAMASNQLTAILLSNTSHAVRTPLSQIINTLELALAGNIDSDTRSMLENSHQASRALLFHVHDLLDLTRIETGNETAFNDPFDLRQTINDAVRLYRTESDRRGLDFRVHCDDSLPKQVIGDSGKIKTVVSNLVANSVKFTESGWVEVSCSVQKPESGTEVVRPGYLPVEIVISDSGVGISSEKLEAMFVTLEGAEELRTAGPTGLGLGLAVVARIVEQLNGQLRAESEVGVGTRFFFTLQMLLPDARGPATVSSDSLQRVPRRSSSSGGSVQAFGHSSNSASVTSELDSFVQDFGSSHMVAPVANSDPRLREARERMSKPGTFPVTDSSYPVRPSRMDAGEDQTASASSGASSAVPSGGDPRPAITSGDAPSPVRPKTEPRKITAGPSSPVAHTTHHRGGATKPRQQSGDHGRRHHHPRSKRGPKGEQQLRVLVVEDDAINSQILQKRLRMDKHEVVVASNGQEAVTALQADWDIDAVLMDIQMPIMDGRTAAKEIRKIEPKQSDLDGIDPLRVDGRIPIFAVSASLYESDRPNLAQDFDGWLLKPLDFPRVRKLLAALEDPQSRSEEVYAQGHWERGGYLRGDSPKPPTTA